MPHNFKDLIGKRFGRLKVIERLSSTPYGKSKWLCQCECGNTASVLGGNLLQGASASCGCARRETCKAMLTWHGHATGQLSTEYKRWASMKDRCCNPNQAAYAEYGGAGILVCDQWINDFSQFLRDMGPIPSPKHTLERKNNSLGYSPDNCVWATAVEQANNKRNNRFVVVDGVRMTAAQAARRYNVNYNRVRERLLRGWSAEEALNLAPRQRRKKRRRLMRSDPTLTASDPRPSREAA